MNMIKSNNFRRLPVEGPEMFVGVKVEMSGTEILVCTRSSFSIYFNGDGYTFGALEDKGLNNLGDFKSSLIANLQDPIKTRLAISISVHDAVDKYLKECDVTFLSSADTNVVEEFISSQTNRLTKELKYKLLGSLIKQKEDLINKSLDSPEVIVKTNEYWKQRRANYDNIKSAEDFNRIVGNPVMDSVKKHKEDLIKILISLQVFNESWCGGSGKFRLNLLDSLKPMGINPEKVNKLFGMSVGISPSSAEWLTKAIKKSIDLAVLRLPLVTEMDTINFSSYCIKRAQLILEEKDICPFDYYDDNLSSGENLRIFKDLHLLELRKSVELLEVKLMAVIPESCKLNKGFEDFINPDLDYHTEMSKLLTEESISEILRILDSTQEGPGKSRLNDRKTKHNYLASLERRANNKMIFGNDDSSLIDNDRETKSVDTSEFRTVSKVTD